MCALFATPILQRSCFEHTDDVTVPLQVRQCIIWLWVGRWGAGGRSHAPARRLRRRALARAAPHTVQGTFSLLNTICPILSHSTALLVHNVNVNVNQSSLPLPSIATSLYVFHRTCTTTATGGVAPLTASLLVSLTQKGFTCLPVSALSAAGMLMICTLPPSPPYIDVHTMPERSRVICVTVARHPMKSSKETSPEKL